jgi:hypothetical protein
MGKKYLSEIEFKSLCVSCLDASQHPAKQRREHFCKNISPVGLQPSNHQTKGETK